MELEVRIVFFDIGSTLGSVGLDASGVPVTFEVYKYIPSILEYLKKRGIRIGVISYTGDQPGSKVNSVISESTIWQYLDADLLIYSGDVGLTKDSPRIFVHACQAAKVDVQQCLYVGEDSWERLHAMTAGMSVSPHPLLVQAIIQGEKTRFARLSTPENLDASQMRTALQGKPFVPLHVSGRERSKLVGVTTTSTLAALANAQIEVETLGPVDGPLLSDLYILKDDRATRTGFLSFDGQSSAYFAAGEQANWLVSSSGDGLIVALPAGRSVEEFHFEEAHHGHNLKLSADLTLLTSFDAVLAATSFVEIDEDVSDYFSESESKLFAELTSARIEQHIGAYIGKAPLGDGGEAIRSRHIHSIDNERVVRALARHLASISEKLRVHLHPFTHEGRQLFNVEAEIGPDGPGELILVTAHLDSTAASSPPYDPRTDEAPGADDDASGVAGVLAIAEVIVALASLHPPERTIRFVLFNAEEHGLVGSKAYARDQAARGALIAAVLQMDMIGYNVELPRSWELHAGYSPSESVQTRSLGLAKRVSRITHLVSPKLQLPQIYISEGQADRDPAEGRSDHAAFHERGYTACAASEDFFAGPGAQSPEPEGNPHYHKKGDTFVDSQYTADIARVIAASAWTFARSPAA